MQYMVACSMLENPQVRFESHVSCFQRFQFQVNTHFTPNNQILLETSHEQVFQSVEWLSASLIDWSRDWSMNQLSSAKCLPNAMCIIMRYHLVSVSAIADARKVTSLNRIYASMYLPCPALPCPALPALLFSSKDPTFIYLELFLPKLAYLCMLFTHPLKNKWRAQTSQYRQ